MTVVISCATHTKQWIVTGQLADNVPSNISRSK